MEPPNTGRGVSPIRHRGTRRLVGKLAQFYEAAWFPVSPI